MPRPQTWTNAEDLAKNSWQSGMTLMCTHTPLSHMNPCPGPLPLCQVLCSWRAYLCPSPHSLPPVLFARLTSYPLSSGSTCWKLRTCYRSTSWWRPTSPSKETKWRPSTRPPCSSLRGKVRVWMSPSETRVLPSGTPGWINLLSFKILSLPVANSARKKAEG